MLSSHMTSRVPFKPPSTYDFIMIIINEIAFAFGWFVLLVCWAMGLFCFILSCFVGLVFVLFGFFLTRLCSLTWSGKKNIYILIGLCYTVQKKITPKCIENPKPVELSSKIHISFLWTFTHQEDWLD